MLPVKVLVRTALRLREVFVSRAAKAAEQALLDRLAQYQQALDKTRASMRQATEAGWMTSASQVRRNLCGVLWAVRIAVSQTIQQLKQPTALLPSIRCLVEDLRQLDDECDGLDVDVRNKTLRITTEPIELEGVYLGSFAVQLNWARLAQETGSQCFEIIALEPYPAATNEAVTHPHVSNGVLCAGDAKLPIQRALEQGRLADAFCLVRSVLTHYNPSSPYVSLDDWNGQDCYECGCSAHPDDLSYCERCGYDYCQECVSSCTFCDETRCNECLERCPLCEEACCAGCLVRAKHSKKVCCRNCLRICTGCGAEVARDELDSQAQLCAACVPDETESEPITASKEGVLSTSDSQCTETVHEPIESKAAVA